MVVFTGRIGSVAANDAFFYQTVLLLNGENSVVPFSGDISATKSEITVVGSTSANTFNPMQDGYYSNYFNGSSDYLSVPSNAALIFGSNDFTIESWVYLSAVTAAGSWIYSRTLSSGVGTNFFIYNSYLNGQYSTNGTSNTSIIGTTAIPLNTWNHVAYTRSSSTLTLWLNGVSQITAAISGTLHDSGTSATIGTAYPGVIYGPLAGYISNVRIVKGTAVYTTSFTPPTAALTTTQLSSTLQPTTQIDYLVVAGGGGGGGRIGNGGGGGAGGLRSTVTAFQTQQSTVQ